MSVDNRVFITSPLDFRQASDVGEPRYARSVLCQLCERSQLFADNFVNRWLSLRLDQCLWDNFTKVQLEGHRNCMWCRILLLQLQEITRRCGLPFHQGQDFTVILYPTDDGETSLRHVHRSFMLSCAASDQNQEVFGDFLQLTRITLKVSDDDEIYPTLGLHPFADPVIDYRSYLPNLYDWMHECEEQHAMCPNSQSARLPLRTLEVLDDRNGKVLRLCVNTGDYMAKYAALSYRWGGPQRITTTTKNIDAFQSSIPETELPATIRDAIRVTRLLKIRYLWIDAFCVLQDSVEDKNAELLKMGEIYSQAFITIAASVASSVRDGFLDGSSSSHSVLPHAEPEMDERLREKYFTPRSGRAMDPLSARGWAVQERTLSPRVVFFGKWGLAWRCRSGDTKAWDERSKRYYDNITPRLPNEMFFDVDPCNSSSPGLVYYLWTKAVNSYCLTSLTFDEDKLPAIAGLAKKFGERFKGHLGVYLGGVWSNFIIPGLLWSQQPHRNFWKRASPRAPTWSWAAVRGSRLSNVPEVGEKLMASATSPMHGYPENVYVDFPEEALSIYGALCEVSMEVMPSETWLIRQVLRVRETTSAGVESVYVGNAVLDCGLWKTDIKIYTLILLQKKPGIGSVICTGDRFEEFDPNYHANDEGASASAPAYDDWLVSRGILLTPAEDRSGDYIRIGWFRGNMNLLLRSSYAEVQIK